MLLNLNNILDKQRFQRRCKELMDKKCIVELIEKRQRTLSQNNYLHLLLGYYGLETGNTLEYVKRCYFKILCNSDIFVRFKDDPHLGKVKILRSSADLTTGELTAAIDKFIHWSETECDIMLPRPEDKEFITAVEIEIAKQRKYL